MSPAEVHPGMNPELVIGLTSSVLALLATVIGGLLKVVFSRFKEYREELDAMRRDHHAEIEAVKREHRVEYSLVRTELDDLKHTDRAKDDYIYVLRDHIDRGLPPPPPDWPDELTRRH